MPSSGSDEGELRCEAVADETKPRFPRKFQAVLHMTLHVHQRVPRSEKVSCEAVTTVGGESEDACPVRNLESAMQQITTGPEGLRPWHNAVRKGQIGSGQKTG
jgi:hypothetical protein